MDEHGFPLVGPGIDYTKVQAIHQKRTLAFLNHFVTHTARFLNRFSCVCEEKLEDLTVRIQRLETSMNILESKLSSIPGLENVTVASSSPAAAANEQTPSVTPSAAEQQQAAPEEPAEKVPEPEPEKPQKTVSQDPRYQKYFKMVQVGVPAAALRGKMAAEGLDPDLLDNPNAPVPDDYSPGASSSSDDEPDSDDFDD